MAQLSIKVWCGQSRPQLSSERGAEMISGSSRADELKTVCEVRRYRVKETVKARLRRRTCDV